MSLHRYAAKRDTPEKLCIAAAESLGAVVLQVSGIGLPDTLVLYRGQPYLVEVKRPGKALTHAQGLVFERIRRAGVPVYVVESPDDVRCMLDEALAPWTPGSRPVEGRPERPFKPGVSKARNVGELCAEFGCPRSKLGSGKLWNVCKKHQPKRAR